MRVKLIRNLHWLGAGLASIGIVFVSFRLHGYWRDIGFARVTLRTWFFMAALAVFYASANLLLATSWWQLLLQLGAPATRRWAVRVYGISQLARYVPGNIFHLAGRQALGMASGVLAGVLAKSTLWELSLIAVAGSLFGWLILPLFLPGFPQPAAVALLFGSAVLVGLLLNEFVGLSAALAFLGQMFFLAISDGIFVALLALISVNAGMATQPWIAIGGAYVIAWLGGLVTPGAPAGVGIREMILLFLLKPVLPEVDLLLAVLLGRLVTLVGDILYFLYALFIPTAQISSMDPA